MPIAQYGVYAFAMSCLTVLVLLSNRGLDIAILRFVPEYLDQNLKALAAGIIRYASRTTILIGGLLAGAVLVWAAAGVRLGGDAALSARALAVGCLLIPLLGLVKIRFAALKGMGHVIRALIPEMIFAPILIIIGTGCLAASGYPVDAPTAMLISLSAFLICFGIGNRWLKNTLEGFGVSRDNVQLRTSQWRRTSFALFVLTGMHVLINNTDIIMLGMLENHEAAGIYTVCSKSAAVIAYTLTVVNAIVIPRMSALYYSDQLEQLKRIVAQGIRFVILMALPVCLFFIIGGVYYLSWYGEDFRDGADALRILSIGQALNALCGPVAFIAALTGHERLTAVIISACAVLNIILNLLFIPIWGLNGAAFSTALTIALWNIVLVIFICKKLKLNFYGHIFRKA